jgi:Acetyltransferase (GNAT) domain
MKWNFYNAIEHFGEFRSDWDALNQTQNKNHILLDSRFVAALTKHFGSPETVLAVSSEGPKKGLALLERNGAGSWATFQPSQSPLGLILLSDKDDRCELLFGLMRALPGYTVLLSVLQQDPPYSPFTQGSEGSNIEILPYMDTPRMQISGTFEDYWGQRSKNLRHNLDRQTRRAKEQGICFELIANTHPEEMADSIREYGRIESAGWKSEGGTAIHESNAQGKFFTDIFEDFARTQEAVVYQLRLNGKVVATDLCLRRDGMLVVLKTTYDETVEKFSPALLMRREITREVFADGEINVVEFYGRLREWHKQWMTDARTMFHINAFRNLYVVHTRRLLKRFQ